MQAQYVALAKTINNFLADGPSQPQEVVRLADLLGDTIARTSKTTFIKSKWMEMVLKPNGSRSEDPASR